MVKLSGWLLLPSLLAVACDTPREPPPRFEPRNATASSQPAPSETASVMSVAELPAASSASASATASAAAPATAIATVTATATAMPAGADGKLECFCMSWVHRDENGENCYPTRAKCDEEFRTFGRKDKIPCSPSRRARCESFACRGIGKECFRL